MPSSKIKYSGFWSHLKLGYVDRMDYWSIILSCPSLSWRWPGNSRMVMSARNTYPSAWANLVHIWHLLDWEYPNFSHKSRAIIESHRLSASSLSLFLSMTYSKIFNLWSPHLLIIRGTTNTLELISFLSACCRTRPTRHLPNTSKVSMHSLSLPRKRP